MTFWPEYVMVKKKSLPPREQKLLAWRIGMKLGSAIDRHRHAHWHLKQKGDATAKRNPQPDIHVPTALANEVGMMQDFEACEELAKTIGFALAPLEGSVECRKLFYRSNKLTPEDVKWIPGFIESVDKRVEAAYDGLKGHLKAKGEVIVALFDLAVHTSISITSPDDPASLTRIASNAEVPAKCTAPFLKALSGKAEADELRKELARLDKSVERILLYGESVEGAESS
jgi:hypothetical protein